MIRSVRLSVKAKHLRKLPKHIVTKLMLWTEAVESDGLEEVRKIPGYHDEPLDGAREGQRSIRLNDAYRAIYVVRENEVEVQFADVIEAHKHKY